nr:histone deacetylase 14 [Quercus suber]
MEIADSKLLNNVDEVIDNHNFSPTNRKEECLISMVKVGVACSVDLPQERWDISKAISELHLVRDILLGSRSKCNLFDYMEDPSQILLESLAAAGAGITEVIFVLASRNRLDPPVGFALIIPLGHHPIPKGPTGLCFRKCGHCSSLCPTFTWAKGMEATLVLVKLMRLVMEMVKE